MRARLLLPSVISSALILAACGPTSAPSGSQPLLISENLADARTPVLRGAYFEKNWGKPDVEVMSDGTYQLRYRQGTSLNHLMVRSLTKPEPTPATAPDWVDPNEGPEGPDPITHRQAWRHTTILGKPVKWYQKDNGGGADFPAYRTEDFALTAPDGRTGFYRIIVFSDSESKVADWIPRVGW
jgi:hypothetical protein